MVKKLSPYVEQQLPGFVREDHPNFVLFLKAYYQWMEQTDGVLDRISNLTSYADIDRTSDEFMEYFAKEFIPSFPKNISTNKANLIKNVKDFYNQRGNEASYELFFRVVFDKVVEFYYPSTDILKVDDGTWQVDVVLRTTAVDGDGFAFKEKSITGSLSGSTAVVEYVIEYQIGTETVYDLYLSSTSVVGEFLEGETVTVLGNTLEVKLGVKRVTPIGGKEYQIGDPIRLISENGRGFQAVVSRVSNGQVKGVKILDQGIDYDKEDFLVFYPFDEDALSYIDGLVLFVDPSRDGSTTINSTNGLLDSIRESSDRGTVFSSGSSKPILSRKDNKGNFLCNARPSALTTWTIGGGTSLTQMTVGGRRQDGYAVIDGSSSTNSSKYLFNVNSNYLNPQFSGFAHAGKTLRISAWVMKGTGRYVWIGEGNDTVWHGANFDLLNNVLVSSQNVSSTKIELEGNGWVKLTVDYVVSSDMAFSKTYVSLNDGTATNGNFKSLANLGTINVDAVSLMEPTWDTEILRTTLSPEVPGRNGNRVIWFFGGNSLSTSSIEDYDATGDFTLFTVPTFSYEKPGRVNKVFGKNRSDRSNNQYPVVNVSGCQLFIDANYGVTTDERGEVTYIKDLSGNVVDGYQVNGTAGTFNRPLLTRADRKENLVRSSDNISTEYWLKARSSVVQDVVRSDDCTLYFLKEDNTAANTHHVQLDASSKSYFPTVNAAVYNISFRVKSSNRNISVRPLGGFAGGFTTFNIQSNSIIETAAEASNPTITDLGNGVYLCSVDYTANAFSNTSYVILYLYNASRTYNGDNTSGAYIGGVQIRNSARTVSDYISTNTDTTENLLIYSEQFDNSAWTKTLGTVTANQYPNPLDGTITADLWNPNDAGTSYLIQNLTTTANVTYELSVYIKGVSSNYAVLRLNDGTTTKSAHYDLSTGATSGVDAGATASVTTLTNGWFRISLTWTAGASGSGNVLIGISDAGTSGSYTSASSSSMAYVYGAQVRSFTGSLSQTYVKTEDKTKLAYMLSSIQMAGLNGQRAMYFDGIDDALYFDNVQNRITGNDLPYTVVIGFVPSNVDGTSQCLFNAGNSADANPYIKLRTQARQLQWSMRDTAASATPAVNSGTSQLTTNTPTTIVLSDSGTFGKLYCDGSLIQSGTMDTGSLSCNIFTIGAQRRTTTNEYMSGFVTHCLVFNRELTDNERAQVEAYIRKAISGYSPVVESAITMPQKSDNGLVLESTYSKIQGKHTVLAKTSDRTPVDISSIPNLQLWLDGTKKVTANSGNLVSAWGDLSHNGFSAVQATDTNKPVLTRNDSKENGLIYSNLFTNSNWDKATYAVTSVTAGQNDPFGGTGATRLLFGSGNLRSGVVNTPSLTIDRYYIPAGFQYRASIYVKKDTQRYVWIGDAADSIWHGFTVDLDTGMTMNGNSINQRTTENVGNGWWRVSYIATKTSTSSVGLGVWHSDWADYLSAPAVTGKAGTEACFVSSAQVQFFDPLIEATYIDVPATKKEIAGINGNAGIFFDADQDVMTSSLPQKNVDFTGDFSFFAVVRSYNDFGVGGTIFTNYSNTAYGVLWQVSAGKQFIRTAGFSGANYSVSGTDTMRGGCDILFVTKSGTTASLYRNGVLEATGTLQNAVTSSIAFSIGALSAGSSDFNGVIGEIIMFNNAISNSDRDTVMSYLNAKWRNQFSAVEDTETFPRSISTNEPKLLTLKKTGSTFEYYDNGELVQIGNLNSPDTLLEDAKNELSPSEPSAVTDWQYTPSSSNVLLWYKSTNEVQTNSSNRVVAMEENRDLLTNPSLTENLIYPSELTSITTWTNIAGANLAVSFTGVTKSDWAEKVSGAVVFGDNSTTRFIYRSMALNKYTSYVMSAYVVMDSGLAPTTSDFNFVLSGASASMTTAVIEQVAGSLYRVSLEFVSDGSTSNHGVLKTGGNSANTFKINGFQIRRLGLPSTYVATTVTVKTADNDGLLAAQATAAQKPWISSPQRIQSNLISSFQDLTTSNWTKSACSIISSIIANPVDSSLNAFEIREDSTNASHYIQIANLADKATVIDGYKYRFSFYAKANTIECLKIELSGAFRTTKSMWLNLKTGRAGTVNGGLEYHIDPVSNGWWKISILDTAYKNGVCDFKVYGCLIDGSTSYLGTSTKSYYFFRPSIEDINDNKTNRGNFFPYSNTTANAAWTKTNLTTSDNAIASFDGKTRASVVTASAGNTTHFLDITDQFTNAACKGSLASLDFYVQYTNYRYLWCAEANDASYHGANVDLINGVIDATNTVISTSVTPLTDENRLPNSSDLTQASWIVAATTKTSATRLTCNAGAAQHYVYQSLANGVAGSFCLTVRLKYVNYQYVGIQEYDGGTGHGLVVDLINGTITATSGLDSSSITNDGTYWVVSMSFTRSAGATFLPGIFLSNVSTYSGGIPSFTGAGTEAVDFGGMALSKATLKDPIIVTTSTLTYAWYKVTVNFTRTNTGAFKSRIGFSQALGSSLTINLAGTETFNMGGVVGRFTDWESYPLVTTAAPTIASVNGSQSIFYGGIESLTHGTKDVPLSGDYIIAASIKLTGGINSGVTYAILGNSSPNASGFVLEVRGTDLNPQFRTDQTGASTSITGVSAAITQNTVTNVVLVVRSGIGYLYRDGLHCGQASITAPVTAITNSELRIGAVNTNTSPFQGFVNEVIIKTGTFTDILRKQIENYLDAEWKYTSGNVSSVTISDEVPSNWKNSSTKSVLLADNQRFRKFTRIATTDLGAIYTIHCYAFSQKPLVSGDISFVLNESLYAPTSIVPVERYKNLYKATYQFTGTGLQTLYGVAKGVGNSSYPVRVQSFEMRKLLSPTFEIGSSFLSDTHVGQVSAVGLYNRYLTTTEQKIAEDYIRQKFLVAPKDELPYSNETQRRTYESLHLKKDKNQKLLLHYANQPSDLKNLRGSFWVAAFFEPDFGSNYVKILSKEDTNKVFVLEKETGGTLRFRVSPDLTSYIDCCSNTFGSSFQDNTQYFVYAHHEDTVGLAVSVNNGSLDTVKHTTGINYTNFANMYIGGDSSGAKISKIVIGSGTLGESERKELYNNGTGVFYEEISSGLKGKIWSYWELSESSDGSQKTERVNSVDLTNKNFLSSTSDLTVSPWTATNSTLTKRTISYTPANGTFFDNVAVSPNRTNTANLFLESATTAIHSITGSVQDTLEANRLYKISFYFKPQGRDVRVVTLTSDFFSYDCFINGSTGEVLQYSGSIPPRVVPVAGYDGWFYFEKNITTSSHYYNGDVSVTIQTTSGTTFTVAGDTSKGLYFDDVAIEPVSQENPSVTPHVMTSDINASTDKYLSQTISNCRAYSRFTFTVYAKAKELKDLVLELNGTAFGYTRKPSARFNLVSSGTVYERNQFNSVESSITKIGDWYKCTFSAVTNADGTVIPRIYLHDGNSTTFTTPTSLSLLISVPTTGLVETEFENDNLLYQDTISRDFTSTGLSGLYDGREVFLNGEKQNLLFPSQMSASVSDKSNVSFTAVSSYLWQERFANAVVFGDNTLLRYIYMPYTTISGQYYTLSVYVRMTSGLAPVVNDGGTGDFSLGFEGSFYAADLIEDLGGGLFCVYVTVLATGSALTRFGVKKNIGGTANTFQIQGIQLNTANSSKEYLETTDIKGFSNLSVSETFGTENLIFPSEPKLTSEWTVNSNITFSTEYTDNWANMFDRVVVYGDNSLSRFFYKTAYTVSGVSYQISAYVRMDDGSAPNVGTLASSDFSMVFAGNPFAATTVTNLGNGLYRVSYTGTGTGTNASFGVTKPNTYNSKTFKVQGFQLNRTSLSQTYVRTFDKPYYYSKEYFSNAYMDSVFLAENSSISTHAITASAGFLSYGEKYRVNVLAKKKERHLSVSLGGSISSGGRANFDLDKGTLDSISDPNSHILSATTSEVVLDSRENWIPYSKNMASLYGVVTPTGLSGATTNTITCSNTSLTHRLRMILASPEFLPVIGRTYRMSIGLKYLNYRYFLFGAYGDSIEHAIVIDLQNKVIVSGSSYTNGTVEQLDNGITRFSFDFTQLTKPSSLEVGFGFSTTGVTTFPNVVCAGTETVQIEGISFRESRATNEILETQRAGKKQNIWYNCSLDFICTTRDTQCNVTFNSCDAIGNITYSGDGKSGLWLAKPTLKLLNQERGAFADRDLTESFFDVSEFSADSTIEFGQVINKEGYYVDERGQLDTTKYLRDDYFYQEWSYVLFAEETLDFYKDHVNKILHPSGTKMFGGFRFKGTIE